MSSTDEVWRLRDIRERRTKLLLEQVLQEPANHRAIAREAHSGVFYLVLYGATIIGMLWLGVLIQTIIDWLREIPPDLLGRKVERLLDQSADRHQRGRKIRGRKAESRKRRR